MKKVYYFLILSCFITFLFSACDKKTAIDCNNPPSGARPFTYIEFRDNQDRDLLNPATPGHYDTSEIRKLNPTWLRVGQATVDGTVAKDHIFLAASLNANATTYQLRLSATVSDEIKATFNDVPCQISVSLKSFSYNGIAYPVTTAGHFIVIK
jgi:glutamine cyclotransferase